MLIFQEDAVFSSSTVFDTTTALVAAIEEQGLRDEKLLLLDATAFAHTEPPLLTVAEHQLTAASSLADTGIHTAAYVLWPATARLLLESIPLDAPVSAFLGKQALARNVLVLAPSPGLV